MDCPVDLKEIFKKEVKKVCNFNRICNDDLFKLLKILAKIRKNTKDLCKETLTLFLIKHNEQTKGYSTDT